MAKRKGKRYLEALKQVDRFKRYDISEAVNLAQKTATAKFNESIDMAVKLNLKKSQTVRSTVSLPYGTGKERKVLVFAKGDKAQEAKEAGADYVGLDDLIEKIQKEGWIDFDVVIATPDVMKQVSKLGPILGPRKLMPNPKMGTVTMNVAEAVKEFKKGRVEYRSDKSGNVHMAIGRKDMPVEQVVANAKAFFESVLKTRPQDHKGEYVKSVAVSSTMGPGVKVDYKTILESTKD